MRQGRGVIAAHGRDAARPPRARPDHAPGPLAGLPRLGDRRKGLVAASPNRAHVLRRPRATATRPPAAPRRCATSPRRSAARDRLGRRPARRRTPTRGPRRPTTRGRCSRTSPSTTAAGADVPLLRLQPTATRCRPTPQPDPALGGTLNAAAARARRGSRITFAVRPSRRARRPRSSTPLRDGRAAAQRRPQRRPTRTRRAHDPTPHPTSPPSSGVAMLVVLMALVAGTMLERRRADRRRPDLPFARESQDRKQAYAAAEAGARVLPVPAQPGQRLLDALRRRAGAEPDRASPVNQRWKPAPGRSARVAHVPERPSAKYTIELIRRRRARPVRRRQRRRRRCSTAATGTFRSARPAAAATPSADVVTTLRRTLVPRLHLLHRLRDARPDAVPGRAARPPAGPRELPRRAPSRHDELPRTSSSSTATPSTGPFHTNDTILAAATTTLGRTKARTGSRSRGRRAQRLAASGSCGARPAEHQGHVDAARRTRSRCRTTQRRAAATRRSPRLHCSRARRRSAQAAT